MAIDTAEKRKSISGVGGVPLMPGVTPNSSQDAEWRQEASWSYSGILVGAVPAVVFRRMIDVHTKTRIVDPKG